jgi:uncharacterized membrane protein YjdF
MRTAMAERARPSGETNPQPIFFLRKRPRERGWIVIAVVALGAVMALPAFLDLMGNLSALLAGDTAGHNVSGSGFDLAYLALGAGLMLRKKLAREVYCVLAAISLVFVAVFGAIDLASGGGALARLIPVVVVATIPLVFLSHPAVKRVFS